MNESKHCDMSPSDMNFYNVYVYPDGEQYDTPPDWKSDDYEVRQTTVCNTCEEEIYLVYGEPLGCCGCGVQEWGM